MKFYPRVLAIPLFIFLIVFTSCGPQENQKNWVTTFEKSDYLKTSGYDETIEYFKDLADYSEYARLLKIGDSPQGREILLSRRFL